MSLVRINRNPPRRQLAIFGVVWLVFFAGVGGVLLGRSGSMPTAAAVWGMAVVVPVIGWILPGFMRIVYLAVCYAAWPIGLVLSHVTLAVVYYVVVTATGWLVRLFGYDSMSRGFDPDAKTYWCPRKDDQDTSRYFRQY
ncbi:MAG: hypothetical protein A2V70_08220 [Planctomycetes bacterium RBG_13_63_9]|nr:MAG: hypothetical protein A2V70_08220 [Planctomycetes bacterium RBG_13_63_9]